MASPDLVLLNGDIRTIDPFHPRARALASRKGRVIALGDDTTIRAMAGPATTVIDVGGRLVLPGFQDTHIHLQDSGQDYSQNADLGEARTPEDILRQLSDFASSSDRAWVNGVGWYSGIFGEHNLDRHLLDRAVPDRPCMIVASDGHNACLNSRACDAIGLRPGTPDPLNGHFVLDAGGVPTGMLYEHAIKWAEAHMPRPTDQDFADGVRWAQALANRHGITGVLDAMVEERHVRVYRSLAMAGELTLHVAATALVTANDSPATMLERSRAFRADGAGRFKVHSTKFFFDGVLENRTGAMIEPYSDPVGGNAPPMFEPGHIRELFTAADADRFQIHVHAIGDRATRAALDGMAVAQAVNGAWPSLHQIAHIQCLDPADAPRFGALGVMGNVQPLWARHEPSVTDIALPMLGNKRGRRMYAFRSLIDVGAALALSSDWGVSTLNPFEIIETAMTRMPPERGDDHPPFLPEERLTIEECVAGYTVQAARAAWRSDDTGTLGIGKCADIIVLDRDIFTCPAREIAETQVLLTLLGGMPVHSDGINFAPVT